MVVTIVRLDAAGLPPRAGVDRVGSTKVCCVFATMNVPVIGGAVVVVGATVVALFSSPAGRPALPAEDPRQSVGSDQPELTLLLGLGGRRRLGL